MSTELESANIVYNLGNIITPIAILGSSIMAGTIAINISKRQKAVELLQAIKMDRRVDKGLSTLRNIHDDSNIEVEFYGYAAQADSNEAKRIRYLLNTFEQLASGISDDIYDETIIKRSKYTTIVNTYKRASKFIDKVQESQPTAYQELKALSEKWKAKPLKEKGRIEKLLRALRII